MAIAIKKLYDFWSHGALALPLLAAFFLTLFYKGGIGLSNHFVFFFLVGISGVGLFIGVRKGFFDFNDFPRMDFFVFTLFVVLFGFSFLFSSTKNVGLLEICEVFSAYILVFSGYVLAKKTEILEKFLGFLNVVFLFSLMVGFGIFFVSHFGRFAGSFFNYLEPWSAFPNAFGDFAILLLPTTWFLVEKGVWRRFFMGVFLFGVVGIFLTGSKGIFIVATGMLVLAIFRAFFKRKLFKELIVVLLVGLLLGVFFSRLKIFITPHYRETIIGEAGEVIDPVQFEAMSSFNTRVEHYKVSIDLLRNAPFFGYGPGSYPYVSAGRLSMLNTADHPHNLFLKLAIENGIFTSAVFFIFIFGLITRSFFALWRRPDALQEFLLLGLCGFFVHQLIDYNLQFTTIIFLVFLYAGMLSHCTLQNLEETAGTLVKGGKFVNFMSIFLVGMLSILLVSFSLNMVILRVFEKVQKDPEAKFLIQGKMFYRPDFLVDFVTYKVQSGASIAEVKSLIESGLQENSYDARLYALKGDFETAYRLNPHRLRYLLGDLLETKKNMLKIQVKEVLEKYLFLLSTNTNFTILTENPSAAISLAQAIGDQNLSKQLTAAFEKQKRIFEGFYGVRLN